MAGLLDLLDQGGPGALYGGALTPDQQHALAGRGLLALAGALGQAGMPSRLPVPFGAALGQAAAAMGQAQDSAALNAMRGGLLGLQGQQLQSRINFSHLLLDALAGYGAGAPGAPEAQASDASAGAPASAPAPVASPASAMVPGGALPFPTRAAPGAPAAAAALPFTTVPANPAAPPGSNPAQTTGTVANGVLNLAGAPAMMSGLPAPSVPAASPFDFRRMMTLGLAGDFAGFPSVATLLAADPAYKGAVAGTVARAQYPFEIGKIGAQTNADILKAGPVAQAQQNARIGPELAIKWGSPMDVRSNGLIVDPRTGRIVARNPALPEGFTAETDQSGNVVAIPVPGALPAIKQVETTKEQGKIEARLGGLAPAAAAAPGAPSTAPATVGKPTIPLSEQFIPDSPLQIEKAVPEWQKRVDEWTDSLGPARQAEMRLLSIASAYKMTEPGTFATHKAELAGALKALGMSPQTIQTYVTSTNPGAVQLALHENYLQTLTRLRAANSRFTGQEFRVTSENAEHPNIQPEANLEMLSQDIAIVRQAQQMVGDWNHDQASGWRNPVSYETAWNQRHPLGQAADAVKKEIGPLKGMESPASTLGAAVPQNVPPGSSYAGHSPSTGLNYWKGPDGKFYAVKP